MNNRNRDLQSKAGKRYLMIPLPAFPRLFVKQTSWIFVLMALSNYFTYQYTNKPQASLAKVPPSTEKVSYQPSLYLLDKAATHVADTNLFSIKVRQIAGMLGVAPEWLMAVMYHESKFDHKVLNYRGSGAVGLIQFLPSTARGMNISTSMLMQMSPDQQLDYVYQYLADVKATRGTFNSLTDLYLGILYPKAVGKDYCYTLFSKPSIAYKRNIGLDENRDGMVTVSDVDKRLRRIFPTAFAVAMN